MERNCHLIDLHKVIMAVILTAIKNQKNLHTLLDKPCDDVQNVSFLCDIIPNTIFDGLPIKTNQTRLSETLDFITFVALC